MERVGELNQLYPQGDRGRGWRSLGSVMIPHSFHFHILKEENMGKYGQDALIKKCAIFNTSKFKVQFFSSSMKIEKNDSAPILMDQR